VASGDPLDDRVILWTRITPERDTLIRVSWKVATDTAFKYIVAGGTTTTDYTKDYTVKVDATGLQPGITYYYYFSALGRNSMIGRTNTLPLSTVQHARFAVVSCSNYQMGYFNAYKRIAERSDLDAVLHLGDYIYEYPSYGYGYTAAVSRIHRPDNEIITLDDYRIRHSFYKLDPDLRAAHQQHPFITIWDDHEIANNTWEHGAANHDSLTEGDFDTRKQSAIRAYLEWMPIRHPAFTHNARIYRRFTYGNLADVQMLDTRVEERDKQASSVNDPALRDSSRVLLGDTQRQWMFSNMTSSTARWQILANQIMFSQEGVAPSLDSWTGYPGERAKVIKGLQGLSSKNNIILLGDTHRSWAFDLTERPHDTSYYQPLTGKGTFGVEWGTPSVASPNRDESSPGTSQAGPVQAALAANPHLRFQDQDNHGYFVLDLTPARAQADFFFVDTKQRSTKDSFAAASFTNVNTGYLQQATSPSRPKGNAAAAAPVGRAPFVIVNTAGISSSNALLISGIYPNPAHDHIYVGLALNEPRDLTFRLTDMTGRVVTSHNLMLSSGNHKIGITLDHPTPGTYLLSVRDTQGYEQTRKVVVE
jgi:alkaline phosphatase D